MVKEASRQTNIDGGARRSAAVLQVQGVVHEYDII